MFGPEDHVHVTVLDWLQKARPDAVIWHVPNGGHRTRGTALKMQRLGVLPGVADLEIVIAGAPNIYLEIKGPKTAVSPEQRQFGMRMIAAGRHWAVVRGVADVRTVFRAIGIAFSEPPAQEAML